MIDISSLPASIGTNNSVSASSALKDFKSIGVQDEQQIYTNLSHRLIEIEKRIEIEWELVFAIEGEARQMMLLLDEKNELLMRCNWLNRLYDAKEKITTVSTMSEVKRLQASIRMVQTCPLKSKLIDELKNLEQMLDVETAQLSDEDTLNEAIFNTGSQVFINLGTVGRSAVLEEVLNSDGQVHTAIAKAEELEALVQDAKQCDTVETLQKAFQSLPLGNLVAIPAEYEEEVLQKLLDNPIWNGLFHLDRLIHQYTAQIVRLHEPEQEGIQTTLDVNEKIIKRLGLQ